VQSYPEVLHVQHALGLRSYQTGPVVEAYVDAELASGNAVGWWLEIHWDKARWLIESSIRLDHEGGEDTITAFPPRKAVTLTELLDQLKASVIELGEFVAIVRATVQ
jgi:hypothetical protein